MSLAEEWFADYIRRAQRGGKKQAVLAERRRPQDAHLWRERAYDAETEALLAAIRAARGRGSRSHVGSPPPAGSAAAVERLLARITKGTHAA